MEFAKITSKGQITIPAEIRKKLHLKPGDKVLFVEDGNKITVMNSSLVGLRTIQQRMQGQATKNKLTDEKSVVDLVRSVRRTRRNKSQ